MKIEIKLFGIAKEIVKGSSLEVELLDSSTVAALRTEVMNLFPAFGSLKSIMVAVNSEYANNDQQINENDEVALIPPVSGG